MGERKRAYLGQGDWIEFREAALPPDLDHVDIPLRDVAPMVVEVLRRDMLDTTQATRIIEAARQSLRRQSLGLS